MSLRGHRSCILLALHFDVGRLACKYVVTDENIKSWKCRRRKMLQADSAGRVRLNLIVRDFSDLQPREDLEILSGKSRSHLSKK